VSVFALLQVHRKQPVVFVGIAADCFALCLLLALRSPARSTSVQMRAHIHTHTHTHSGTQEYKSVCALIRNAICNESERAGERHIDGGRQTDRVRQIDRHRRVYFLAKRRAIFSSRVSFSFVFFFGSLPLSSSEESLLQKPHGIIILIIEHTLAGGRSPAAP